MNSNILEVNNFTLTSSRDIPSAIQKLENLKKENTLIHVVSFMHNTVLVQTLKSELIKIFPNIKIVLLTHNDKHSTCLTLYSLNKEVDPKSVHDEIIKELYLQGAKKELVIKEYRNKLFSRYFTDHLTNLPNTYRLRNDLDEYKHFALVVFNIDNFHTINNFYGHIVGDYVIEKVGKHLQDIISKQNIYKLAADEFALVIPQNIGFYELKEYLEELCKKIKNIVIEYQNINIYIDFTLGSATNRENKNIFSNTFFNNLS